MLPPPVFFCYDIIALQLARTMERYDFMGLSLLRAQQCKSTSGRVLEEEG